MSLKRVANNSSALSGDFATLRQFGGLDFVPWLDDADPKF
jgi:hypothetical protein